MSPTLVATAFAPQKADRENVKSAAVADKGLRLWLTVEKRCVSRRSIRAR